jgi:murein DD-endopeptidase MepM/ murein hydrolase activator NlpD
MVVALHEGEPVVTPDGVALFHRSCPVAAIEPMVMAPIAPAKSQRWPIRIGASALALGLAFCAWPRSAHSTRPLAADNVATIAALESIVTPSRHVTRDDAPPAAMTPEQRYPIPTVDGQLLSETYPSLIDWIHPVADAIEKMPPEPSRHFGAERLGVMRAECGAGHCGVDLDGPRGRAVVAVADGVVVRVERHELGLDGRSGRYVRIEHDDGTLTAYMHLDDVADGLEVGDRVDGGQYLGTLGATACYEAAPHLHFSLEPAPDRRRGTKPAS